MPLIAGPCLSVHKTKVTRFAQQNSTQTRVSEHSSSRKSSIRDSLTIARYQKKRVSAPSHINPVFPRSK